MLHCGQQDHPQEKSKRTKWWYSELIACDAGTHGCAATGADGVGRIGAAAVDLALGVEVDAAAIAREALLPVVGIAEGGVMGFSTAFLDCSQKRKPLQAFPEGSVR